MNPDIILTGIPRSGTTLTCHLLDKVANTVALIEPMVWTGFRDMTDHRAICDGVDQFFRETRRSCLADGTAITRHAEGEVTDNTMGNYPGYAQLARMLGTLLPEGNLLARLGLRKPRVTRGVIHIDKLLAPDFRLCVKHTGPFTALLPELLRHHDCYGVVRHPLSVLASWSSINFAMRDGRNPEAERMLPQLAQELSRIPDRIDRQIHLVSWFCRMHLTHLPAERIIRYEDIINTHGAALGVVVPEAASLNEPLESRNKNKLYDQELMLRLADRLRASDGPIWDLYRKDSIEEYLPR